MIVTVFRSRLNPDAQEKYAPTAKRLSELARTIPGYISHKSFVADDCERITIVEFESEEALRRWRIHPEHVKAKRRGIESFFSDYKVQICNVIHGHVWQAKEAGVKATSLPYPGKNIPKGPVVTADLIKRHAQLAHEMRNAAIRQAVKDCARAFLRVLGLPRKI